MRQVARSIKNENLNEEKEVRETERGSMEKKQSPSKCIIGHYIVLYYGWTQRDRVPFQLRTLFFFYFHFIFIIRREVDFASH